MEHAFDGPDTSTFGTGFTVIVYVTGLPIHPLAMGVTVIVTGTGLLVPLLAINPGVLPVPLAPIPMLG
jgi:hypothetical protein